MGKLCVRACGCGGAVGKGERETDRNRERNRERKAQRGSIIGELDRKSRASGNCTVLCCAVLCYTILLEYYILSNIYPVPVTLRNTVDGGLTSINSREKEETHHGNYVLIYSFIYSL